MSVASTNAPGDVNGWEGGGHGVDRETMIFAYIVASGLLHFHVHPITLEASVHHRDGGSRLREQADGLDDTAITYTDDLKVWLYSVKIGLINETRYSTIPDDEAAAESFNSCHVQCITNARLAGLAQG
jgi:hypothetical protein